jgi:hypothetical protein
MPTVGNIAGSLTTGKNVRFIDVLQLTEPPARPVACSVWGRFGKPRVRPA